MIYSIKKIKIGYTSVVLGSWDYCSPSCGKTIKGISCSNDCEKRGNNYYWCNVGETWDYCSRNSCPIQSIDGYTDCSTTFVGKTVWFEYLYYPGYWLAKGYSYMYAALWKPGYHHDLFCHDEGYGWSIHKSEDGHSVLLETTRPGYKDFYFIGVQYYWSGGRGSSRHETNLAYMDSSKAVKTEAFSFRIMCRSCSSSNNCIILRAYDETKLYSNHGSELRICKNCGSANWFDWRVYSPTNNTLKCSSSSGLTNPQSIFMISIIAFLTIKFFQLYHLVVT